MNIYTPKGKAREYSPLALNHYKGCTFGCTYCYVPQLIGRFDPTYNHSIIKQRTILATLRRELVRHYPQQQVLLSFTTDPYNHLDIKLQLTRKILQLFVLLDIPTAILSKGGKFILRDIDLFKKLRCKIGQTIVTSDDNIRKQLEPYASSYKDRIDVFKRLHKNGIRTWISIEPLFNTIYLDKIIDDTIDYVDEFFIGQLSGHNIDINLNTNIINNTLNRLRKANKSIYIKESLRKLPGINVIHNIEDNYNLFNIK